MNKLSEMNTKMPAKQPRLTKKEKKAQMSDLVNSAKAKSDLLHDLQEWTVYKKHGLNLKIESASSKSLSSTDMDKVFSLLKTNMQHLYERSTWGWNEETKMAELTHDDARYLLVRDHNGAIVGFSHFRFDVELNLPILYCYELQIYDAYQRKGIGRHLMNILSLLAYQHKLTKIVLTVFNDNLAGINFYMKSLLFKRDVSCPFDEEGKCYIILRKSIVKAEISAITC